MNLVSSFLSSFHFFYFFYLGITLVCSDRYFFLLHNLCVKEVLYLGFFIARSIAEAAPTWLSPKGSSSSKLVLQGEELLLECIAAGV